MEVKIDNNEALLDCSVEAFMETAIVGLQMLDDYQQLAGDKNHPELVDVYVKAYDVVEKIWFKAQQGLELTQPRRNMVLASLRQAMLLADKFELR